MTTFEDFKPFLTPDFVIGTKNMKAQELLEGICRHRAHPVSIESTVSQAANMEIRRKVDEIEWALQAIAEKLVDLETVSPSPIVNQTGHA